MYVSIPNASDVSTRQVRCTLYTKVCHEFGTCVYACIYVNICTIYIYIDVINSITLTKYA